MHGVLYNSVNIQKCGAVEDNRSRFKMTQYIRTKRAYLDNIMQRIIIRDKSRY